MSGWAFVKIIDGIYALYFIENIRIISMQSYFYIDAFYFLYSHDIICNGYIFLIYASLI